MNDPKIVAGIKALSGATRIIPHHHSSKFRAKEHAADGHGVMDRAHDHPHHRDRYAIGLDGRHVHCLDQDGKEWCFRTADVLEAAENAAADAKVAEDGRHAAALAQSQFGAPDAHAQDPD